MIDQPTTSLKCHGKTIHFPRKPMVMSIVNINDDSFSGDGTLDADKAMELTRRHIKAGADIIDIGAESARTNRDAISIDEEIARLSPFIDAFKEEFTDRPPLLSINTWRPEVANAILPLGVDILNDIGALPTPENAEICAKNDTALLIMHSVGAPKVAHLSEKYPDVISTMRAFFEEKIEIALSAGLSGERIILDPGIDFAKQRDDNLRVYRDLEELHSFGRPILLPVSRKTVIGDVLKIENPQDRDAGTVSSIIAGIQRGAHIFRVHNTDAALQAIQTMDALKQ